MQKQQNSGSKQATPVSNKSVAYSLKSTASAPSADIPSNINGTYEAQRNEDNGTQNPHTDKEDTTDNGSTKQMGALQDACSDNESSSPTPMKWRSEHDVLQLEDVPDISNASAATASNTPLKKNGSLASLHSKSESIKTQLGDTPTVLSRTQSAKSLLIEEDIEDNSSFVVMDELHSERQGSGLREQARKASASSKEENAPHAYADETDNMYNKNVHAPSQPQTPVRSRPQSRSRSPTIAEIKMLSRRNSMIKSMESLYERPPSKQELVYDQTSTESGSATSSQLNTSIPIKPQHTPLKQKAKTSHFLKNHRRISPVKQAIKMPQAELYPPTLQRFDKPRDALLKTFDQLDSSNWEIIMLGLKSMVRLMRYHPEQLENQMHMVCIQLTRSVRNLRSQVSRAACQATTELFTLKSKCLEQECDDLVCALLHRTADTNRFLRADATRALESMCDNLTPPKILNILTTKGALHQNALVRTTTAKLLHRLVERLGSDKVYTMTRENRDKFFVTGANLLLEGSLETRSYAKSIFRLLSDHPNYNRLLTEVIPARTYRNVEKTLKSIR
uniref:Protein FAM179B n=2 Tax=Bactrocera latifrons TaxID=174628 RepID=A0A0K8UZT1_BACLA